MWKYPLGAAIWASSWLLLSVYERDQDQSFLSLIESKADHQIKLTEKKKEDLHDQSVEQDDTWTTKRPTVAGLQCPDIRTCST